MRQLNLARGEDDFVGAAVGAYQVIRLLGAGGMGRAYLARRADGSFDRDVVIKIIDIDQEFDDELVRHFERERRILASMAHPYIATLFDGGRTIAGHPYFVLEYVDGRPITDHCNEHRLSLDARIRLFCRVCEAVSYAHRALVVHRDLKPANILVEASGTPKLLDFGIAKPIAQSTDADPTVRPRATPAYASPEQLDGAVAHTGMDVYALGVILHELLTGLRPQHTTSDAKTATSTVPDGYVRASDVLSARRHGSAAEATVWSAAVIRGDLDAITDKALRPNPSERYTSVDALSDDLLAWLDHRPVLARGGGKAYTAAKFVRRHAVAVAIAGIAAVSIVVALATLTRLWNFAEERRASAERQLASARQLANAMFALDSELSVLDGSTTARRMLVDVVGRYLSGVDLNGERELRLNTAEAYRRLGDIEGNPNGPNLGAREAALEKQTSAIQILERLDGESPGDQRIQAQLAYSMISRGDVFFALERFDRAESDYQRALAELSDLARRYPDNPDYQMSLAGVYRPVGDIRLAQGDPAAALDAFERALAIGMATSKRFPDRPGHQRLHALTVMRIASAEAAQGAFDQALEHYDEAARVLEALSRTDPNRRAMLRDLAVGLTQLAQMRNNPDTDRSVRDLARALEILRRLVSADPADARTRRDLMVTLVTYGDAMQLSAPARSLAAYREARQIARGFTSDLSYDAQRERDQALVNARLTRSSEKASLNLEVFTGGDVNQRRIEVGGPVARAQSRALLAASAPPGWTRYVVLFGAEGPADVLDETSLVRANWTVPLSGPHPAQTVLLLASPRRLSSAETDRLARDIGAVPGPRVVDSDSHIIWTDRSQRLESVASARGERDTRWVTEIRARIAALGEMRIAGRTFPLASP